MMIAGDDKTKEQLIAELAELRQRIADLDAGQVRAEEVLEERLRFETLLSGLSAAFINLPASDVDRKIEHWLERLVKFLNVDRGAILEFSEDKTHLQVTHSYAVPGIQPTTGGIVSGRFPWFTEMLRRGEITVLGRLPDDVPGEAIHEKQLFVKEGIKSHLSIPLAAGGSLLGAVAIASFRTKRSWPDDMVQRLRLVGEIFANALVRQRAEEALAAERHLLRTLIDNLPDYIYVKDTQARFVTGNVAVARLMGAENPDELLGKTDFEFYPEELATQYYADDQRVMRSGQVSVNEEVPYVDQSGSRQWLSVTKAPLCDNSGENVGLVGIGRDITERKRADEALRRYAERLRILREIDQGILAARSSVTIAQAALGHVRQLVPCMRAGVTLFDLEVGEGVVLTTDADAETEVGKGTRVQLDRFEEGIEALRQGRVARTGELQSRGRSGEILHAEGVRSLVSVPLIFQGELIGSLNLWMSGPGELADEYEDAVRQVADQLAVAIQQARLSEAEVQRRREAEALRDIAAALSSTLNLEDVLDRILANVGRVVPHEAANIMLIEDGVAQIVRSRGYAKQGLEEVMQAIRFTVADMPGLRQMAESGQPLAFPDTHAQSEWIDFPEGPEVRSYTAAPICHKEKVIGFLNLDSSTPGFFNSTHAMRLQAFADQAAVAIENARLHKQVQRHAEDLEQRVTDRTRELSVLHAVATIASEGLGLQTALARSLERVFLATGSDAGAIHILDEVEETLHLAAQRGFPADLVAQVESIPSKNSLGGWVIEHGRPLTLPDVTSDPRMPAISGAVPRAYIGVPMRAGGQTLGVLSVLRETDLPQFDEEEMALLTSVADQIGVIVESTRLRQRAERAAVVEERGRLARDLHDSVTQSLYSLTLLAETGRRSAEAGDLKSVAGYLDRLGEVAQQSLREMRLLLYELRPAALEQESLVGALQQRLDAVEGRAGVEARLLVEEEVELPATLEEALYRIALEALNNALKHAGATRVTVRICTGGERVELEIVDNGRGFDLSTVFDTGGMGLVTMRERAERLGGALTILSTLGEGTRVKVSIETRGNS